MNNAAAKKLHRANACALALFILLHLTNHISIINGIETHIAVMDVLRSVYRRLPIELIILALFTAQIALGIRLIWQRGKPTNRWAWLQVLSGGYIAFFLLQHIGAVLVNRVVYHVDTNAHFAADVVETTPLAVYFIPYYILAVTALFAHIACAARFAVFPKPAAFWHKTLAASGFPLGIIIVVGLRGAFG